MVTEKVEQTQFLGLRCLFGSYDEAHFLNHHWGQRVFHVSRGPSETFGNLFSLKDLDKTIGFSMTRDHVSLWQQGAWQSVVAKRSAKTLAEVYEAFQAGHPVKVDTLEMRHRPLGELVNTITREFGFAAEASIIGYPPGFLGEVLPVSGNEVFYAQLSGHVSWQVVSPIDDAWNGETSLGDSWYIPAQSKGCFKTGKSSAVFFIVVKVKAFSMFDLLEKAIARLSEKQVDFRKNLPFGLPLAPDTSAELAPYIRKKLVPHLKRLDWVGARDILNLDVIRQMQPLPNGHFPQMREVAAINEETLIERRPGMVAEMHFADDNVVFEFPGSFQVGPEKLFLAWDFFKTTESFKVKDIPGWYNMKEKIVCVQHLVRKGYLRIK